MPRPRRTTMVAWLLCLPVFVPAGVSAGAWLQADSWLHRPIGQAWVGHVPGHRVVRVRITGSTVGDLAPGVTSAVRLGLMNPNPRSVSIRRVKVTIDHVAAPRADASHPCTPADFQVRQMARGVLRIPGRRMTDLAGLGLPVRDWPQLRMLDRPFNQDGCKHAEVTLTFRAHRARVR